MTRSLGASATAFAALAATACGTLLAAALPSAAGATSLYWTHEGKPLRSAGALEAASVGGGGQRTLFAQPEGSSPEGIALDPATGEVYWAEGGAGEILAGSIAGSASSAGERAVVSGQSGPSGVAIDPISGKLYWADSGSGAIMSANLNGTEASTLFTGEGKPMGVAVDPASGRLYWADLGSGEIRQGSVNGAQAGAARTLYEGESGPAGIALDAASGRLYWTDATGGEVRVGSVFGSEAQSAATLYAGQSVPVGIAVDEQEGKLYWTDFGSGSIESAGLSGSVAGFPGAVVATGAEGPSFLALLSAPKGTSIPAITGSPSVDGTLSCSEGEWEADLPGASFYQAPEAFSYRWTRNGVAIFQASSPSLLVGSPGSYVCEATASNAAGEATQSSAAVVVKPASPPVAAAQPLKIEGHRAIVRGKAATVRIACFGATACRGRLALVADVKRRIEKGRAKRIRRVIDTRGVTLATARYAVGAGAAGSLRLRLSARAMRMLSGAYGHRLEVWAVAAPTQGGGRVQAPLLIALPPSHGRQPAQAGGAAGGEAQGGHRHAKHRAHARRRAHAGHRAHRHRRHG